MNAFRHLLCAALLPLTAGCATIVNGNGQLISVNTIPDGATCDLNRNGQTIGQIPATPGSIGVDRSRKTIVVTCEKPGYQPAVASNLAHSTLTVLGNILVGGLIGFIVDESTGADYEYASTMHMTFPEPRPPVDLRGARISSNPGGRSTGAAQFTTSENLAKAD